MSYLRLPRPLVLRIRKAGPHYSSPAQPATRMTYAAKVNADAPGGLEAIGAPFVSTAAKSYSFNGG